MENETEELHLTPNYCHSYQTANRKISTFMNTGSKQWQKITTYSGNTRGTKKMTEGMCKEIRKEIDKQANKPSPPKKHTQKEIQWGRTTNNSPQKH